MSINDSDLSEAQLEASRLSRALQQHEINVEKMDRRSTTSADSSDTKTTSSKSGNSTQLDNEDISLLGAISDLHLENPKNLNNDAVMKVQAQLEDRVQKILDKLTILANGKYAKGKIVYDYQLVKLSEAEAK